MAPTEESSITKEEKIAFIERSFNPLDTRGRLKTKGLDELSDANLDKVYELYLDSSRRLRETFSTLFLENPHLSMVISSLSDSRINRLFSSMKVIRRLEWIERFAIGIAIVASLIFVWGMYDKTMFIVLSALGVCIVDMLFISELYKRINVLMEDPDVIRVFPI